MDSRIPTGPVPARATSAAPVAQPARRGRAAAAPQPQSGRDDAAGARLRPDTSRGADALMHEALGRSELPPPLELMAALDSAKAHAPLADRAVPGLGRLVGAVIDDERFKLGRMLDLGRQ